MDQDPKTLAEVAQNASDAQESQSPNKHSSHQTLAEAAMAYDQEHTGPSKAEQLSKITVVTGEEEERNVLQVSIIGTKTLMENSNPLTEGKGKGFFI